MQILHDPEARNRLGEAYAQTAMTTTKARARRRALVALACAVIATAGGAAKPRPRPEGTRAATANRSGYAPIGPQIHRPFFSAAACVCSTGSTPDA